nr:hypothetical protein [Tanacetum cinerariifolium]
PPILAFTTSGNDRLAAAAATSAARWTTLVSGMARPRLAISDNCRALEASITSTSAPLTTCAPARRQ